MKLICKYDSQGFYVDGGDRFIDDNEPIPDGYTDNQPMIKNNDGTYTGFFKAKWTGSDWVEDATEEEIDNQDKQQPQEPTLEERTTAIENALLSIMME